MKLILLTFLISFALQAKEMEFDIDITIEKKGIRNGVVLTKKLKNKTKVKAELGREWQIPVHGLKNAKSKEGKKLEERSQRYLFRATASELPRKIIQIDGEIIEVSHSKQTLIIQTKLNLKIGRQGKFEAYNSHNDTSIKLKITPRD